MSGFTTRAKMGAFFFFWRFDLSDFDQGGKSAAATLSQGQQRPDGMSLHDIEIGIDAGDEAGDDAGAC